MRHWLSIVDLPTQLLAKINPEPNTGCWLWSGALRRGYGRISRIVDGRKRSLTAHRHVWELLRGRAVPEGLVLDHMCRVRDCVNPDHMEAVTARVNIRRSYEARNALVRCSNGHANWARVCLCCGEIAPPNPSGRRRKNGHA